ncbi:MAG: hypothetical protein Q8P82_02545 [bacterium]|nr:hypothetical protein [bacterium]
MSLFRCTKCNCVENTAVSRYWFRGSGPALCSACDPALGTWHGQFEREDTDKAGYVVGADGFLYLPRAEQYKSIEQTKFSREIQDAAAAKRKRRAERTIRKS